MKILIIKLGAKGDVVRSLPLLVGIKEKYPQSEIHWIVKKSNIGVVEGSPEISKIWTLEAPPKEKYDILYNFDIDEEATSLAMKIKADKKYGFYSEGGFVSTFNLGAEYYLNTLFDDETKINNRKTYQEMMFMAAELEYHGEFYPLSLEEKEKSYAQDFAKKNNLKTGNLIGIHLGSSARWPSKFWPAGKIKEFIQKAKENGYEILLFGGPDDIDKQKKIVSDLEKSRVKVCSNNPKNTDREFASLVSLCDFVVCGDSFALHISLALSKKTIALFFCTSPGEVEGYGFLKKIISPMLYDFFPEKQDIYSEELVNSISAEEVLKAIKSIE